jgi:hypothetical protein
MTAPQQSLPNTGHTAIDPALAENLGELTAIANQIGAEGIWLVRGVKKTKLIYSPTQTVVMPNLPRVSVNLDLSLNLPDAGVLVIIRFPDSDGRETGLEKR